MSQSATVTVRLPQTLKDQLAVLSERTRRTSSFLAGEAIAAYVQRELEIIAGVEQGVEDMRNGRLVDHADAMAEVDAAIDAVLKGQG
jgi:predicted transcriptional regulator